MDPQAPNISVPEIPQIVQPSNHSNNITIISMAIFVLLSLGAVAFLYYQNQQLKTLLAGYQTPIASPTPTATTDPTANWKTYTNNYWKISFKYPDTLFKPCLNYVTNEKDGVRFWKANFTCPDGHDIPYKISFIGYDPGKYIEYKKPALIETITVGGKQAEKKTYIYDESDGPLFGLGQSLEIVIKLNKGTMVLQQLGTNTDEQKAFDQILSTFKFLGAEVGVCKPNFPIETNMPELTASENYAVECTSKKIKNDCLLVDIYNAKSKDFSKPDGIPDCDWTDSAAKACAQEAKLCPDGSSVGRTGPNCEFPACPTSY